MSLSIHATIALLWTALAAPLGAQCPNVDLSFAAPRSDTITALAVHDTGTGPRLYAANNGSLSSWDGERWTYQSEPFTGVRALRVHDFGTGPQLVVGGAAGQVSRWTGANWVSLGAGFDGVVSAFTSYDDGSGSRLVATGSFQHSGASSTSGIAVFDGATWTALGSGITGSGLAVTTLDRGNGPELVVGGNLSQAGGQPIEHLASWNGVSWSSLASGINGRVLALLAEGTPGSQALVVGGEFTQVGGVSASYAARLSGGTWSKLGAGLSAGVGFGDGVHCLLADGAGIIAGGNFGIGAAPSTTKNIARFDGVTWQPFGPGLGQGSFVGIEALAQFDPTDGSGSRLFAAGGFAPLPGQPTTIAQWNGALWSALRDDGARGLVHQASQVGATSATMWQGDLVLVGEFNGAGAAPSAQGVARFDGHTWSTLGSFQSFSNLNRPTLIRTLDLGAGPELVLGMYRFEATDVSVPAYRWDGTNWVPFASGSMATGSGANVTDAVMFDDGAGPQLFVAGQTLRATSGANATTVLRWTGSSWSAVGAGPASQLLFPSVYHLDVYDDGTGSALYAVGQIDGGIQRWNGTSWSIVGAGLPGANDLEPFDDGSGMKLYAGGIFQTGGPGPTHGFARWDGAAWVLIPSTTLTSSGGLAQLAVYDDGSGAGPQLIGVSGGDDLVVFDGTNWTLRLITDPYFTFTNLFASDQLPGGGGILLHGNFREVFEIGNPVTRQSGLVILRDCPRVTSFCSGDGLDAQLNAACPCANTGAPDHGCAWSASGNGANGGHLTFSGSPSGDSLVLVASSMPTGGSSLFFQGSAANPAGAVFGDGLRCANGTVIRLRTRINQGGAASVPTIGEPSLASLGQVTPGSGDIRAYQVWFRVSASFCTSAPFNTTNALQVRW